MGLQPHLPWPSAKEEEMSRAGWFWLSYFTILGIAVYAVVKL